MVELIPTGSSAAGQDARWQPQLLEKLNLWHSPGHPCGPVAFLAMVNTAATETDNKLQYVDDLTIYQHVRWTASAPIWTGKAPFDETEWL